MIKVTGKKQNNMDIAVFITSPEGIDNYLAYPDDAGEYDVTIEDEGEYILDIVKNKESIYNTKFSSDISLTSILDQLAITHSE
jgi:hypothetical protein